MKKIALFFTVLCAGALNGEQNIATISPSQMQNKDQAHRELLGKVKKLEGYDVYVGAGYSDAGEQMFFAMEKLDNKNKQVWENYAEEVQYPIRYGLMRLGADCNNQAIREKLKDDLYSIQLMDTMCPTRRKTVTMLDNDIQGGVAGFKNMLKTRDALYVAYVSPEPITGLFTPKKNVTYTYPADKYPLKEFEDAYSNIIISIAVDMKLGTSITEHRGVFKNPFYMIGNTYKNIWLKLHGWAGAVEKQIFNKTYMTVYPNQPAAALLHRSIKPGDMYIGIDTEPYPYKDEELKKKFPPVKQEFIGTQTAGNSINGNEPLHAFELEVLSNYYTAPVKK